MTDDYIAYWGLARHPFLLAPDCHMMNLTGQYYECLERLRYAISTGKGGVLVISEDAGLGKTTTLLKFIDQMKEEYGAAFRYAFIDHPTLTASQMIAQITEAISGQPPDDDKLRNLTVLKNALVEVKEQGGRSVIIVDEGQMLCEEKDVLQELRVLINLTHNNEYLHTFILSGQKILWDTVREMPEFWQRLPVRYYFVPLRLDETMELVKFRLRQAGLGEERDIFSDDAIEMIHKFSKGSPRTLIALADLCLLIGYTGHAGKVTFKEVSKAIAAMSGKGDTLPYSSHGKTEKGFHLAGITELRKGNSEANARMDQSDGKSRGAFTALTDEISVRPAFVILAVIFFLLLGGVGYRYLSLPKRDSATVIVKKEAVERLEESKKPEPLQQPEGPTVPAVVQAPLVTKPEIPAAKEQIPLATQAPLAKEKIPTAKQMPLVTRQPPLAAVNQQSLATKQEIPAAREKLPAVKQELPTAASHQQPAKEKMLPPAKQQPPPAKEKRAKANPPQRIEEKVVKPKPEIVKKPVHLREALVVKDGSNVRLRPDINASRIGMIFSGEKLKVLGEKTDKEGNRWFKIILYGDREGWISGDLVTIR